LPVGRSLWENVRGNKVKAAVEFHQKTKLSQLLYEFYKEGLMKDWSVGFIPIDSEPITDEKTGMITGRHIKKWAMHEFSAVPIGANQFTDTQIARAKEIQKEIGLSDEAYLELFEEEKENAGDDGNKIRLLKKHIDKLSNLPEQGVGYQIVDIKLIDGKILTERIVLNSTFLKLKKNEILTPSEIETIELHNIVKKDDQEVDVGYDIGLVKEDVNELKNEILILSKKVDDLTELIKSKNDKKEADITYPDNFLEFEGFGEPSDSGQKPEQTEENEDEIVLELFDNEKETEKEE
jgi:hypothetical protein